MVLYLYNKGFQQFHFGYASAIAWALFLIVLGFTALVLRSSAAWVYYEGEMRK
jgi:multiple sugar transport system permease protein